MNQSVKNTAETYARRIWDENDLEAINDLLHEDVVIHSLLGDFQGPAYMKKVVQAWLTAFPDLVVTNTAIICEEDLAVIHWEAHGSHLGEFKGIQSTGKAVAYRGVTIYRIRDHKICEYWAYLDMEHILNQIRTSVK